MYKVSVKLVLFLVLGISIAAQHRGDEINFQGLSRESNNGVKAQAMGGAFTAYGGNLGSIFYNPAGLAEINDIQISFSGNIYNRTWQEAQVYRPNRQYVTLPFILDGLYIPNPENNGMWDNDAFLSDSNYIVSDPALGTDPYGDGADWKEERSSTTLNNVALAFPFELMETKFTLAAAYSRKYDILDYDKNQTYLDPHIGHDGYGGIPVKVTALEDSLKMNWYDYTRSREGELNSYSFALSSNVTEFLNLGLTVNVIDGSSEETQSLNKIGTFTLAGQNLYHFVYDSSNSVYSGNSSYNSVNLNIGGLLKLRNFNFGFNITPAHTVTREWTSDGTTGEDEMEIPLSYSVGVKFTPVDNFSLTADYGNIAYSDAEFNMTSVDSLQHSWVDQTALRFGFEYSPVENLSLMAGYKTLTEIFVPDGAADKENGPTYKGYSFGASYKIMMVELIAAYEFNSMKYYDSYISNTNYNKETFSNIYFGATISL